ncbi:MAG: sigma-70 family RNA polymerase sigma factor, partial [Bacteroidota bacterium]
SRRDSVLPFFEYLALRNRVAVRLMPVPDQKILDAIRQGDQDQLGLLYDRHRQAFIAFAANYGLREERAVDLWQDSIIAFYENVTSGKLTTLTSSLKTYLFSIGRFRILDEHRRQKRQTTLTENGQELIEIHPDQQFTPSEANEELDAAVNRLGDKCRQLLVHFYYDNFAVEAIAHRMGYANENTVSAHKSRCMKKLRELLTAKPDRHAQ